MPATTTSQRRFDVAISYPGERRDFVEKVAGHLAAQFGEKRVLYDRYHEAEFARPELDLYLPPLYSEQSELIAVFLCPDYARKPWCLLEWRQIRQLITSAERCRIMFLSFGDPGDVSSLGIQRGDGYFNIGGRKPEQVGEEICERLRINRGGEGGTESRTGIPGGGSEEGAKALAAAPDLRKEWVAKTTEILAKADHAPLYELLRKALKLSIPKAVAEAMDELSNVEFVDLGNMVGEDLVGDGMEKRRPKVEKLAAAMEDILESGLAARLGSIVLGRVILKSEGGHSGGVVRLPCVYPVMAEFANAGMDKRVPRIDDVPPAGRAGTVDPWGELREHGYEQWPTLCVPFAPKVGFGQNPMDRVQAILNHLMMALGIPAHVRQSEPQEKLFERVNNRLRTMATPTRFRDQVERWYCLFVPDDSDESMRKLREWLPALRICALSAAEAIPDEDDLIALLTRFYSRKRKRMANA